MSSTETSGDGIDRRQWLGFALLVAGVVLVVAADAHPILGTDNRLLVVVVATATLMLGLFYVADRRVTTGHFWRPPDPEPGTQVPVPGESFERLSDRELRARIRKRALVSLIDAADCTRETAESHLANGTWTDDRLAAAFLGDELEAPPGSRLRARLTGADLEERARTRAMAEIASLRAGTLRLDAARASTNHGRAAEHDLPEGGRP